MRIKNTKKRIVIYYALSFILLSLEMLSGVTKAGEIKLESKIVEFEGHKFENLVIGEPLNITTRMPSNFWIEGNSLVHNLNPDISIEFQFYNGKNNEYISKYIWDIDRNKVLLFEDESDNIQLAFLGLAPHTRSYYVGKRKEGGEDLVVCDILAEVNGGALLITFMSPEKNHKVLFGMLQRHLNSLSYVE